MYLFEEEVERESEIEKEEEEEEEEEEERSVLFGFVRTSVRRVFGVCSEFEAFIGTAVP